MTVWMNCSENVRAAAGGFLTSEDRLRFFVEGKSGSCAGLPSCIPKLGTFDGNTSTGTATMRRDGFASIEPRQTTAPGMMTTEPLTFSAPGDASDTFLFVNVDVQNGALQVELLVNGVSTLSSVTIQRRINSTKCRISWRDGTTQATATNSVAAIAGSRNGIRRAVDSIGQWPPPARQPQLRFTLTGQVQLYAFWLTHDARCGSSRGPVAGGGRGYTGGWNHPSETAPCPI